MFKKMLICMTALAMIAGVAMNAEAATSDNISITVTLANISVSVTPDTWAMGTIAPSSVETQACVATNDVEVTEDFKIAVSNSGDWTAGGTAAENVFVMKEGATVLSGTPATLATGVAGSGGTKAFDLEFTAPSPGSVYTEQTITVTVSALVP